MNKMRRSMLYIPGSNPGMILDAGIHDADCIVFDLEDSVDRIKKDFARFLVCEALAKLKSSGKELFVRVNTLDTEYGLNDLEAIVRTGCAVICLPRTHGAEDVIDCEQEIARIEAEAGLPKGSTRIMVVIESSAGVINAREIALSSGRITAIAFGAEGYAADLKTKRTREGIELLFGRGMTLFAAKTAGISAIDTAFMDVDDEEGFRQEAAYIKMLGFDGKSVIDKSQIRPTHEAFAPSRREIELSLAILDGIRRNNRRSGDKATENGQTLDSPVADWAQRVLNITRASGGIGMEVKT